MFKVTVRGPDGSEKHYPLGADQGLIVGRDDTCDIVLPSKRVSRRHARFYTTATQLHVEDLGSQNGVFVGGARIAGDAEIRPGPPIEIGEFNIRIRREDFTSAEMGYVGTLEGFGSMEGRRLNLPTASGVVGRDDSADIVVADDSVSRRHAEIRFAGPTGYYIKDLESSNGTYLNGARLAARTERPLRPNDRVNFGDTGWIVAAKSTAENPATELSRRKAFITVVAFFLVITGIVVLFVLRPPKSVLAQSEGPAVEEHPAIDRCQQDMANQKWVDAQKTCAEAYDEEPFTERRRLVRQAQRELHFKDIYDDCSRKASVGSDREAVERCFDIAENSSYFPQARLLVQQLATGLMRDDGNACREAGRTRAWDKANQSCRAYLRFSCHNGVDADALKILHSAGSALKGKAGDPWQCPKELGRWFRNGGAGAVDDDTICKPRYDDKDICAAMVAYYEKKDDDATRKLGRIKGKLADTAASLSTSISFVAGKYKIGQGTINTGSFSEAEAAYKQALDTDQKIMQPNVESSYAKDIKDTLAQHYEAAGDAAMGKSNCDDAFRSYMAGAKYRSRLLNKVQDVEKVVAGELSSTPTCDRLNTLLTCARPESTQYQEIKKRLGSSPCK